MAKLKEIFACCFGIFFCCFLCCCSWCSESSEYFQEEIELNIQEDQSEFIGKNDPGQVSQIPPKENN